MLLTLAETRGQLAGIPLRSLGQGTLKGAGRSEARSYLTLQDTSLGKVRENLEFTRDREKNLAGLWQDPRDSSTRHLALSISLQRTSAHISKQASWGSPPILHPNGGMPPSGCLSFPTGKHGRKGLSWTKPVLETPSKVLGGWGTSHPIKDALPHQTRVHPHLRDPVTLFHSPWTQEPPLYHHLG